MAGSLGGDGLYGASDDLACLGLAVIACSSNARADEDGGAIVGSGRGHIE